jgi:UDP-N-acetylglucosamine diphosphorylase / glucose-1-phosphate thymidylyltransferase / UDP-N-acetylgalactosamine diphosphorylase / glucosamine-1-phosphate N-acetyltransferase / galactosamine-1-phosphate N-acetyltransferase
MFMKAIILAAGLGTRMLPLTANTHKILLKVGDRPLIEHAIESLKANGIVDVILVVNHLKEQIKERLGDGSRLGVNISYVFQENPKGGTGNAVLQTRGMLKNDESFILLNGDLFFHSSIINKMIKMSRDYDGLIASKEVDNPSEFGIFEIKGGLITKIHEKPKNPPSNMANLGIYILPAEIFEAIEKTPLSKRGECELTDSIQILIDKGFRFRPVSIDGFWLDVGRPSDLDKANDIFEKFK